MSENGNYIRGIFWTLILASFAWGTTVLFINSTSLSAHCKEAEAKTTEIKTEMISRDELMLKEISKQLSDEFKGIHEDLAMQRTDIKWIKEKIKQ